MYLQLTHRKELQKSHIMLPRRGSSYILLLLPVIWQHVCVAAGNPRILWSRTTILSSFEAHIEVYYIDGGDEFTDADQFVWQIPHSSDSDDTSTQALEPGEQSPDALSNFQALSVIKPANQDYSIFALVIGDGGFSLGSKSITFIASGPSNPGEADRWRRISSFSKFRDGPVQIEAGSPELSLLPHTYYNNGSVLIKVKVIGGTPIENEVNWMLDLSFMTLTLQPGQLGGSYTALNSQIQDDGSRIYGLYKDADGTIPEQYQYTFSVKASNIWSSELLTVFYGESAYGGVTDGVTDNPTDPPVTDNVEFVTVKGLKDVYSDDGSVTISFQVSGGVAEGERVEWTWSDPYITLTPGQSDGSYHATDKQVRDDGSRIYSLQIESSAVDTSAHYYSFSVESDDSTSVGTYTFKSTYISNSAAYSCLPSMCVIMIMKILVCHLLQC